MKLIDYLANGALINILKTNSGRNPPEIWITRRSDGTFHYVFHEETGSVGGQPAPFGAFEGEKIFRPKVVEVKEYLLSFGLSKEEVELTVEKVGISP